MTVDVVIEDPRWVALGLEGLAEIWVSAALTHLSLDDGSFEVAILGCDDARIAVLNADFREKDRATNVLSWPSAERGAVGEGDAPLPPEPTDQELGDIAISYDTCAREAEARGIPLTAHTTHLVVHGLLHLLGYDHERNGDAALMERLETEILGTLGIPDPYGVEG